MAKKMLIDTTHKEETRIAVTEANKLIEYEYESQNRKPLKGGIYLAKVTRVEPSLQAAFVNFGGNRHGFLPFSEIHPDYFRIPVADREALMAEQEELLKEHDAQQDEDEEQVVDDADIGADDTEDADDAEDDAPDDVTDADDAADDAQEGEDDAKAEDEKSDDDSEKVDKGRRRHHKGRGRRGNRRSPSRNSQVEVVGGEDLSAEKTFRFQLRRKYKIQEVIKRGQIMLVQVNKEERGNKGAAVGTYLSLPGRYCVLMPNSPRAGGVSRKIANHQDRARMRDIMKELEVPKGMSVIVRTAGVSRTKVEIKRDLDYLTRLWNSIRDLTLQSTAPALVYEEADLIKRAVRDLYTRDIEEIHVAGANGYKAARDFMKMMIPSHVKKIKQYDSDQLPLFHRYQIENQINEIGQTEVRLKSGGYLVINPTEALVSVDVNSGKSTKGRHIEETAVRTNLEAAEEVARQLKLRDLGGLVVIDFIDMEDRRNNAKVERKMKDALSTDRARVQVGRISSFGLMELSRQRLNASLTEAQYEKCKVCSGLGLTRTADAMSIMVVRAIEEEGIRGRASQIIVEVVSEIALYILNHKRNKLAEIEKRYNFQVLLRVSDDIPASDYRIEVSKPVADGEVDTTPTAISSSSGYEAEQDESEAQADDEGEKKPRRSRRGRGRKKSEGDTAHESADDTAEAVNADSADGVSDAPSADETTEKPKRRRGGRRKASVTQDDTPADGSDSADITAANDDQKADDTQDVVAEEKPKKPARKRKPKSDDDKAAASVSAVESGDAEQEPAPKRKPRSTTKVAVKVKEQDAKPQEAAALAPVAVSVSEVKPEAVVVEEKPAPVQEAVAVNAAPEPAEYEVVNQVPEKKKKGWWNRLRD